MKIKLLLFLFLLFNVLFCNAQTTNTTKAIVLNNDCPPPTAADYKSFCDSVALREKTPQEYSEYFEYGYEVRLMKLACADITTESREAVTEKISRFWDRYKQNFRCKSSSFNLDKGSVLKFAVELGFAPFLETIVGTYQMDINFIDPADGLNVLDYVNDELKKAIISQGSTHPKVKVLKEYKQLLEDLGGKPSK